MVEPAGGVVGGLRYVEVSIGKIKSFTIKLLFKKTSLRYGHKLPLFGSALKSPIKITLFVLRISIENCNSPKIVS